MKQFGCCCGWSYIVGAKHVYGPIYPQGIGNYPNALAPSQRLMGRKYWAQSYSDCEACFSGAHNHGKKGHVNADDV